MNNGWLLEFQKAKMEITTAKRSDCITAGADYIEVNSLDGKMDVIDDKAIWLLIHKKLFPNVNTQEFNSLFPDLMEFKAKAIEKYKSNFLKEAADKASWLRSLEEDFISNQIPAALFHDITDPETADSYIQHALTDWVPGDMDNDGSGDLNFYPVSVGIDERLKPYTRYKLTSNMLRTDKLNESYASITSLCAVTKAKPFRDLLIRKSELPSYGSTKHRDPYIGRHVNYYDNRDVELEAATLGITSYIYPMIRRDYLKRFIIEP